MALVLEHPLTATRRAQREEALLAYAILTAEAERLAQEKGSLVGTSAALQLRLLVMLWHGLNSRLGNGWIEAEPEWEKLRQRFIAVTEQGATPHRLPTHREAMALLIPWEITYDQQPLLRRVAQNLL